MTGYTNDTPPRALILCGDGRLSRLLENELAYLGVAARTTDSLPTPDGELCLLVADGESFPLSDCVRLAEDHGCPLLIFGREPTALPLPAEGGVFLRRPFVLTELEDTLCRLLSHTAVGYPLRSRDATAAPRKSPAKEESPAELSWNGHTLEVCGKPLPLTPAETAILDRLFSRRGETVSREELSGLLGGGGNSVEVYVCKLRAKLEKPLGRRMIITVRGVGYKMEI